MQACRLFFLPGLMAACLLLLPVPALATQDDTQFWLYFNGVAELDEGVVGTIEFSPRARTGSEVLLVRGNVDFRAAPGLDLGGGATWVEFAPGHEFRTHQQATLTRGVVQFRTRTEQRFFGGAESAQLRLRQRVQVTLPVTESLRALANAELLYIARPENPAQQARVDSWRLNLLANYRLSPKLELGAGYLAIYSPRAGAPDRLSHVPMLRLTVR